MEQRYPKFRHHPVHASRVVRTPDEEAEFTSDDAGWTDSLAAARGAVPAPSDPAPADPEQVGPILGRRSRKVN